MRRKIKIATLILMIILCILAIISMDLSIYETMWHIGRFILLFLTGYAIAKCGG